MLDNKGFDNWAGEYDKSIDRLSKGYPFEGYYKVLEYVRDFIDLEYNVKILDLGIGTGLLTYELYKNGGQVHGVDFSSEMIKKAKEKMPTGNFYEHNFKQGIPEEIKNLQFDYIVSSYAIHHLDDSEKVSFILELKKVLKQNGKIIIADISWKNKELMEECKEISKKYWDEEEIYFIGDEMVNKLRDIGINSYYEQLSSCAGVLVIE